MLNHFAILDFGAPELLIILAIVVLLFGSKKLPELSKSIGESVRELKNATKEPAETKKTPTTTVAVQSTEQTTGQAS